MIIQILGTGCSNCKNLEKATQIAISEMGIDAQIIKEEDIQKIMTYGIMRTPALVIDEKVALYGRVPSVKELKEIIKKNLHNLSTNL
jgi:small redox-active disulfide protein 2